MKELFQYFNYGLKIMHYALAGLKIHRPRVHVHRTWLGWVRLESRPRVQQLQRSNGINLFLGRRNIVFVLIRSVNGGNLFRPSGLAKRRKRIRSGEESRCSFKSNGIAGYHRRSKNGNPQLRYTVFDLSRRVRKHWHSIDNAPGGTAMEKCARWERKSLRWSD